MRIARASWICAGLAGLLGGGASVEGQEAGESGAAIIVSSTETSDGGPPVMDMQIMTVGEGGFFMGSAPVNMGFEMASGSDPFSMLSMGDIQKDIELVPEQRDQLKELDEAFAKRMKEQLAEMRAGGFAPDRSKAIGETMKKMAEEKQAAVRQILLPHQIDRLQQISLQSRMKNSGASGVLADKKLAEELGITEEQQEKIRKRAEELAKELQAKIEALREETREELLQELTAGQREKLAKMIGEKFTGSLERRIELPRRIRERQEKAPGESSGSGDRD